jgi:hypothetical protein
MRRLLSIPPLRYFDGLTNSFNARSARRGIARPQANLEGDC